MIWLSRLEMLGFKSFGDRTRLEFGPGVNVIVGPNGSGKSNIADAVRWVLGEQNPRLMRGRKMADLVFSGSRDRRALGLAEVTLVLDNQSGTAPIDYTEISIVRRLYRSGDAEYYINGQPCRMRDIADLLGTCGVGQRGLTIVDQQRLDAMLAPDGAERRILIEEAAGVGRYRARKRTALSKLAETGERVDRLNDLIAELKLRQEPLERQAATARRYQEFRQEQRRAEGWLVTLSLEQLMADREREGDRVTRLQTGVEAITAELAAGEEAAQELRAEIEQQVAVAADQRRNLDRLTEQWRDQREQAAAADAVMRELGEAHAGAAADIDQIQIDLSSGTDHTGQPDEDHDGELEQLSERQKQLQTRKDEAVRDRDRLRQQTAGLNREESQARERLAVSVSRRDSLNQRQRELAAEAERAAGAAAQHRVNHDQLVAEAGQLKQGLANARGRLDEAQRRVAGLADRRRELIAGRDALARDLVGVQSERRARIEALGADDGAAAVPGIGVGQWVEVADEWLAAVDAALDGITETTVVDRAGDVRGWLDRFRGRGWRRTIWPIDLAGTEPIAGSLADVVEFRGDGARRLGPILARWLAADDVATAMDLWREHDRRPVVTRDGTIIGADGRIVGGAGPRTRLTQQLRIREHDRAIDRLSAEHRAIDEEIAGLDRELSRAEQDVQTRRQEIEHLQSQLSERDRRVATAEARARQLGDDEEKIQAELVVLSERTAAVAGDIERQEAELSVRREAIQEHRRELSAVSGRVREIDTEIRGVEQTIAELRVVRAARIERQRAADQRREELSRRLVAAEQRQEQVSAQLARAREQAGACRRRADELEALVAAARKELDQAESQLTALRAREREEAASEVERRRRLSALEGWLRRSEAEIARLDERIDAVTARRDQLGEVDLDGERPTDLDALADHLADVKLRIEQLGPVNPLAIADYKEQSERLQFLEEQRDDLMTGAESLSAAVRTLDREMRELFAATLDRVADAYHEVFRDMFGGGAATVRIDLEDDPLEAVVEIEVQPPGKRLSNLALLSGGERALCAIAFLFALLRVRPSPFCVLDEIDAALDEVNTGRFASFLRRYSGDTQFLTITHQRQTMEAARSLFGVTMAEQGVSRVLSLSLEDLDREAK